jgi:hypothetical protein
MTRSLLITGVVLVLSASVLAGIFGGGGTTDAGISSAPAPVLESPTAVPTPQATPEPTPVANRADCSAIRGTDYHSPEERTWYLANCVNR